MILIAVGWTLVLAGIGIGIFVFLRWDHIRPVEVIVKESPGLEVKFFPGERLPWKGISFVIESVSHDQILLKPLEMTAQMAKRLKR